MKTFFLLILSILGAIALIPASSVAVDQKDINQAAKIFCEAMKAGKTIPDANEAATEYLTDQMQKNDKPNSTVIRQQMRDAVTKICPDQAQKIQRSKAK